MNARTKKLVVGGGAVLILAFAAYLVMGRNPDQAPVRAPRVAVSDDEDLGSGQTTPQRIDRESGSPEAAPGRVLAGAEADQASRVDEQNPSTDQIEKQRVQRRPQRKTPQPAGGDEQEEQDAAGGKKKVPPPSFLKGDN